MRMNKIDTYIKLLIICITFIGCIFLSSNLFMDNQNTIKHILGKTGTVVFILYYTISYSFNKNNKIPLTTVYIIACIVSITCLEAVYGTTSFIYDSILYHKMNPAHGSFDNPAGFSALLATVYPYLLYLNRIQMGKLFFLVRFMLVLFPVAVILSASRTGILCIMAIILFYIIHRIKISYKKTTIISIAIIIPFVYILYNVNKDSANGRLFIWRNTFELIKQKPIFGYGANAFKSEYMIQQAIFFADNPDSSYTMIADNVIYPYNEFINILLEYGIIGLFLLIIFIFILYISYRKYRSTVNLYAAISCLSIILFSCFSYPLSYTCIWIVLGLNIYLLLKPLLQKRNLFLKRFYLNKIIAICIIAITINILYNTAQNSVKEYKWKRAHDSYTSTKSENALYEFQELYNYMKTNPYFLFNYASILYHNGMYDYGYIIAKESKSLWSNYDTEILLGNIEFERKNHKKAIMHYMTASNMCPAKFYPLVQVQQIYKNIGDSISAQEFATQIIYKPVKVKSRKVEQIKELMRYELKIINNEI